MWRLKRSRAVYAGVVLCLGLVAVAAWWRGAWFEKERPELSHHTTESLIRKDSAMSVEQRTDQVNEQAQQKTTVTQKSNDNSFFEKLRADISEHFEKKRQAPEKSHDDSFFDQLMADVSEHFEEKTQVTEKSDENRVHEEPAISVKQETNQFNEQANQKTAITEKTDDFSNSLSDLYKAYDHITTILYFVGYARSRHSLLGSLLDAHPHMIISDENYAFRRWAGGKWREESKYAYFDTIEKAAVRAVEHGRRSRESLGDVVNNTHFAYFVPNQWQGSYDKYIKVIGDKSGAFTAMAMSERSIATIPALEEKTGAKVKFLHVVRNPFDNIATMTLRHRSIVGRGGDHTVKVNAPEILDGKIGEYFKWAKGCNTIREARPGGTLDIISMDIVKKPAEVLRRICDFAEVTCSEEYIKDCAATVDPVASITRNFIEWTEEQKNRVYSLMKNYSFFDGFSFDE